MTSATSVEGVYRLLDAFPGAMIVDTAAAAKTRGSRAPQPVAAADPSEQLGLFDTTTNGTTHSKQDERKS